MRRVRFFALPRLTVRYRPRIEVSYIAEVLDLDLNEEKGQDFLKASGLVFVEEPTGESSSLEVDPRESQIVATVSKTSLH